MLTWIIDFHDTSLWKSHLHVTHHSVWSTLGQRWGCVLTKIHVSLLFNDIIVYNLIEVFYESVSRNSIEVEFYHGAY